MPRTLLIYPQFPETFWGYQRALRFLGLRATHPPLGLLTVAGMLPGDYELRLVDLNIEELTDEHLRWADVVLTGGMMIQRPSTRWVVERCTEAGLPVVIGGPDATSSSSDLPQAAHLVLGEAESPRLLEALGQMMAADERIVVDLRPESPGIDGSPLPRYDILDLHRYASMALQMSRGCPFKCEFCDIPTLFGKTTRYKSPERTLAELDLLYEHGWRGSVFWVDDNFIGNKKSCKDLLPYVIDWQQRHGMPFQFYTQASVNLAADPKLLDLMVDCGFDSVFLGIETPIEKSLLETRKLQNVRFDLLQSVQTIQRAGLEVMAGFIIGFDNDPEDIDRHMVRFIDDAGIPVAMTGLLTAIPGSPLYDRLEAEGRLLQPQESRLETGATRDGDNTFQFGFNFKTVQDPDALVRAYKNVLREVYGKPAHYFRRIERFHRILEGRRASVSPPLSLRRIGALLRSLLMIPTSRYGWSYGRFLLSTLMRRPGRFPDAVRYGIIGVHFYELTLEKLAAHDFSRFVGHAITRVGEAYARGRAEAPKLAAQYLTDAEKRLRGLPAAVRQEMESLYHEAELAVHRVAAYEYRRFVSQAIDRVREAYARGREEAPKLAAQYLTDAEKRLRHLPAAVRDEMDSLYEEAELALQRLADSWESISGPQAPMRPS